MKFVDQYICEMKFKFKIQQYQTDAVESMVDEFAGQPSITFSYQILVV